MTKKAKGTRPIYLDDSHTDLLLEILMVLVGELSVLHDRLDTLERLFEAKGTLSREEIESYLPDEYVNRERDEWRSDYLERVLRSLQE